MLLSLSCTKRPCALLYGPCALPVLQLESVKFTRKNEECRPFEVGGEQRLEFYAQKAQCGLFALGSHTKKRPHNLVLGRFFDGHLLDALELGVDRYTGTTAFGSAGTGANLGSKVRVVTWFPCTCLRACACV